MKAGLRRAYRRVRKSTKRAYSHALMGSLALRNRLSRRPVTGEAPVIVSLTTYGHRLSTVGSAIESIAAGSDRPQRLILWLDEPQALAHPPAQVRRLVARGLELRAISNFGPHKKYFGSLPLALEDGVDLVTADDDVLYPRSWLRRLVRTAAEFPGQVHCYRANTIGCTDDHLEPYESWARCATTTPSHRNFATGVSGVLYPRILIEELNRRGEDFLDATPRADDVWLHWVALQVDVLVRQIAVKPRHFPLVPGSQQLSLTDENVSGGGNDLQIKRLYTVGDVAKICASPVG